MSALDSANFRDLLVRAVGLAPRDGDWKAWLERLPGPVRRRMLLEFFHWRTHGGQAEPPGEWRNWLMRAGRGFGKTLAGAFWVSARARENFAWCDELAKWDRADDCWDNLQMGLRLGARPRLIATTTPRPVAIMNRVRALSGTIETLGRTEENVHSSLAFRQWARETYGGTRLGRQELDGVLFEEPEAALFTREMLEKGRVEARPRLVRVVVGVDPPASAAGDACGIVVCGLGADEVAYVLADLSVQGLRPEGWARAVARAAEMWDADRVIAEQNQGGDMVESVLRGIDQALPVRLVSASRGKVARAEPVAARFETGRARLAGRFPKLEDELAGLTSGGGYQGPGRSPDRADAMVWAMSELAKPARAPRILRL